MLAVLTTRAPSGASASRSSSEVASYFVVSEALANAAGHARASVAHVNVETVGNLLHVSIRDDGLGGADPARGSGLIGLTDRVQALGRAPCSALGARGRRCGSNSPLNLLANS
jgi:signal transduction histidine kinase